MENGVCLNADQHGKAMIVPILSWLFSWEENNGNRVIVCVNYSSQQGQCYVNLPFPELAEKQWQLNDLMSDASYDRDGNDLLNKGHYLDIPAWHYHVFEIRNLK